MGFRSVALFLLCTILFAGLGLTTWIPYPPLVGMPNRPEAYIGSRQDGGSIMSNFTGGIGCPTGMSTCAHLGNPYICCPQIVVISPIKVSMESSCFKTQYSLSGVICCQDPMECERVDHHSDELGQYGTTCTPGFNECPVELGGGCCPDGYGCAETSCYELFSNETALAASGESDYSDGDTSGRNITDDASDDAQGGGYPCVPFGSPTCVHPKGGRPAKERTIKAEAPVDRPRHQVLKSEQTGVLKTGEMEECIGPQCLGQDPLSGLNGGLTSELDGAVQSVIEGGVGGVVLTLTQGVGALITQLPVASLIPGSNNTINIIGTLNPLKSEGHSFMKPQSDIFSSTFSSGHMRYMGLALLFHLVAGMRNNRI
ncbi:hypothetical protein ABW20_dc0100623 [Dactylellina cionopaga]|nr:hypothetical protein ABW20_dc0100623 [Dactylellina cionopaga]